MDSTLRFASARIEEQGVELGEWTFELEEQRVAVISAERTLASLLRGSAVVTAGEGTLGSSVIGAALQSGVAALALCHARLPPGYRVRELLTLAARLAGQPRGDARRAADRVLAELELTALTTRRSEALSEAEQRAVHIARALLGDPAVLVLDRPLDGLSEARAAAVRAIVDRSSEKRRLVLLVQPGPWGPTLGSLIETMDRVVRFAAGGVVFVGPPSELASSSLVYSVIAASNAQAFATALAERGVRVLSKHTGGQGAEGAVQLIVELPEAKASDSLVEAAVACGAPLVELIAVDAAPSATDAVSG